VLYTDIVRVHGPPVEMGDETWATLLAAHHAAVRDQVERHDGTLIKTMVTAYLRPSTARHSRPLRVRSHGMPADEGNPGAGCGCTRASGGHRHDISGVAAHIGSRIIGAGRAGEVLVSATPHIRLCTISAHPMSRRSTFISSLNILSVIVIHPDCETQRALRQVSVLLLCSYLLSHKC